MSVSLKTKPTYIDQKKVRELFEKYDRNRNGVLEREEFIKILIDILMEIGEDIPIKKHREVAEEGLTLFDLNRNGKIEFSEFFDFIAFVVSEKGYSL